MEGSRNKKPAVYIETYGCQMNKYDTELVSGLLTEKGFRMVDSFERADIVMINTCSVRDHAEKRALGRLGTLAGWKKGAPGRKLGVIGCMGQRLGSDLLDKKSCLDFIVGPDAYRDLPKILDNGISGACARVDLNAKEIYEGIRPERVPGITGWIAISRGCDNHCSYCIVPSTRGSERSRPIREILAELEAMALQGYREVTFLGQNVNSYRDGETDFAGLLHRAARTEGILRIRFMTSHPKDLSDTLLDTMARGGKICPHIHLPVQSGSNRILERMNRGYTHEHYLELIEKARRKIPGVSFTTDVIVGFPGESENDFNDTRDLMETVRFDDAYTYAYSPRAGTEASALPETISPEEKRRRLDEVIRSQRRITQDIKTGMTGHRVEVLPEGSSARSEAEWMGRTQTNHVVVFPRQNSRLGEPVQVLIETCKGATLWGKIVGSSPR